MNRKIVLCLALVSLLALGGQAFAELCTIDDVPAATLLLPYFEVDLDGLDDPDAVTTLFSINNASAAAQLVHVVLWTDYSVPTLDFDVYLTGFDVQTINMKDIFKGRLPVTADEARDPTDVISPSPTAAWEATFPNCAGKLPFDDVELNSTQIAHIRAAHTGGESPIFGACAGFAYGDNIARGYVTVDVVNECSLEFPSTPGYFGQGGTGIASNNNVIWGNYHYIDGVNNFAQGETLVHIEADDTINDQTVNNTFYGRYVLAGEDNREPLATTWGARFLSGGAFDGGTDLVVWREGGSDVDGFSCAAGSPGAPFPLSQQQVVAFDEEENPTEICIPGEDAVSPPTGEAQTCFPLEAQRVPVGGFNPVGDDVAPVPDFGWMFLNLNWLASLDDTLPKQSWVTTLMQADGRFSTGMDAIQLDSACTAIAPGQSLVLP